MNIKIIGSAIGAAIFISIFFQNCSKPVNPGGTAVQAASVNALPNCEISATFTDSAGNVLSLSGNPYVLEASTESLQQCQKDFSTGTGGAFQSEVQSYCSTNSYGASVYYQINYDYNNGSEQDQGTPTKLYGCPKL